MLTDAKLKSLKGREKPYKVSDRYGLYVMRQVGSRTKGTMGQTEIDEYEEVAPDGEVIPRYTVTEHTNLRGLNTTLTIQKH